MASRVNEDEVEMNSDFGGTQHERHTVTLDGKG